MALLESPHVVNLLYPGWVMAKKEKGCSTSFIIGMSIIVVFGAIELISNIKHKQEETSLPPIEVTFDTIKDLDSKVVDNLEQKISIKGKITTLVGDVCNYPTADRCYVVLVSENPKSTDTPVHLSVLMTTGDKRKANAVFFNSMGTLSSFSKNKDVISTDLIKVTGHLIGFPTDSGAAIEVETLEPVPE
jgi:hypothetical protein